MPSLAELTLPKRDARRHWPTEDIRLLGQAPDRDVAWRLGTVMQMRGKMRVAKFSARLRRWTKEEDDWLRTMRNQDFSRRCNRTLAAIQQRRYDLGIPQQKRECPWTAQEDAMLWKMSDPDPARQFGHRLRSARTAVNSEFLGGTVWHSVAVGRPQKYACLAPCPTKWWLKSAGGPNGPSG